MTETPDGAANGPPERYDEAFVQKDDPNRYNLSDRHANSPPQTQDEIDAVEAGLDRWYNDTFAEDIRSWIRFRDTARNRDEVLGDVVGELDHWHGMPVQQKINVYRHHLAFYDDPDGPDDPNAVPDSEVGPNKERIAKPSWPKWLWPTAGVFLVGGLAIPQIFGGSSEPSGVLAPGQTEQTDDVVASDDDATVDDAGDDVTAADASGDDVSADYPTAGPRPEWTNALDPVSFTITKTDATGATTIEIRLLGDARPIADGDQIDNFGIDVFFKVGEFTDEVGPADVQRLSLSCRSGEDGFDAFSVFNDFNDSVLTSDGTGVTTPGIGGSADCNWTADNLFTITETKLEVPELSTIDISLHYDLDGNYIVHPMFDDPELFEWD